MARLKKKKKKKEVRRGNGGLSEEEDGKKFCHGEQIASGLDDTAKVK